VRVWLLLLCVLAIGDTSASCRVGIRTDVVAVEGIHDYYTIEYWCDVCCKREASTKRCVYLSVFECIEEGEGRITADERDK